MIAILSLVFDEIESNIKHDTTTEPPSFTHEKNNLYLKEFEELIESLSIINPNERSTSLDLYKAVKFCESVVTVNSGVDEFLTVIKVFHSSLTKNIKQIENKVAPETPGEELNKLNDILSRLLKQVSVISKSYIEAPKVVCDEVNQSEVTQQRASFPPPPLCAYPATTADSSTPVYLTMVSNIAEARLGPLVRDGLQVVYGVAENGNRSRSQPTVTKQPTTSQMTSDLKEAQALVDSLCNEFFRNHSNLISMQATFRDTEVVIKFVVPSKGYIPCADKAPLPSKIGKFNTWICSGWVNLTMG